MLEQHLDKAFDKFTAWTLRNAFDVPQGLDIVMVSDHEVLVKVKRAAYTVS